MLIHTFAYKLLHLSIFHYLLLSIGQLSNSPCHYAHYLYAISLYIQIPTFKRFLSLFIGYIFSQSLIHALSLFIKISYNYARRYSRLSLEAKYCHGRETTLSFLRLEGNKFHKSYSHVRKCLQIRAIYNPPSLCTCLGPLTFWSCWLIIVPIG